MNPPTTLDVLDVIDARAAGHPEYAYRVAAFRECTVVALFSAVGEELERRERIRDANDRASRRWR